MTTSFREQIYRVTADPAGRPLRCSGCGWSASELGPHVPFLNFGVLLFRGAIVDQTAGALLERLDELVVCGECIGSAALLLDPRPAQSARQKASEEQKRLQDEIANFVQTHKQVRSQIAESERRLADLREARDGVAALRARAAEWGTKHDLAAEAFRDARLRVWAIERARERDESSKAAAELAEARDQFEKARGALRPLTTAGKRLGRQCQEKGLSEEHARIRSRLALGDPDG